MFRTAALSMPVTLRRLGLVALVCSAAGMMSGCGGGERAKAYQPSSMVSFGDENSAFADSNASTSLDPANINAKAIRGLVYSINSIVDGLVVGDGFAPGDFLYCVDSTATTDCRALTAPVALTGTPSFPSNATNTYYLNALNPGNIANVLTTISIGTATYGTPAALGPLKRSQDTLYDCKASVLWVQIVAHHFDLGFKGSCALDLSGATSYAAYGDKVDQVIQKVNDHQAELHKGVLVTIMVGQHDIVDLFEAVRSSTTTETVATQDLESRATALAEAIRGILRTDAKVILALAPDLSESPYMRQPVSPALPLSIEERAMLKRMTKAFNEKLYISELGKTSGRNLAGVNTDVFTNPATRTAGYNFTDAACDFTLVKRPDGTPAPADGQQIKYCTTKSLKADSSPYVWADDTHFTPLGHSMIGALAATRAANQF